MKSGNFPEKKNQRRKRALERLKAQAAKNPSEKLKVIIESTEKQIAIDARGIRSKKDRGKAGKRR